MVKLDELLQQAADLNDAKDYQQVTELLTDKTLKKYKSAALYTERARAWYFLQDADKLLEDCNAALTIDAGYYRAYHYLGNYMIGAYKYKNAVANYTKAITLYPHFAEGYNNRAIVHCWQKEYDEAIDDYTMAVSLNPAYADAYNNMGCAWYYQEEYGKAIENFNKAIALVNNDASYYNNRALAWGCRQQYDKAIADFDTALQLNPQQCFSYFQRANTWLDMQQYDKALQDFGKVIALDSAFQYGWAHFKRGNIWLMRKEYDKAISDYSVAVTINEHFTDAYNNRGRALHAVKRYDEAISDFCSALFIDEKNITALYNMGLVWLDKKEYARAFDDFNMAVELDKYSAGAYYHRGLAWYYTNQPDKAIEDFNTCIKINPACAEAYNGRGRAWYYKKELNKAFDDLNKVISLHPNFAEALYTRGMIWVYKQDYNKAIDDFSMAIQRNSWYAPAYNGRALLWYSKSEYKKALEDFNSFIKLAPGDAFAHSNAGLIWHHYKDYNKAIEYYNKAIALNANMAEAYCRRGNALYAKNEFEQAIEDYRQAIMLDSSFNFLTYNIDLAKSKLGEQVDVKNKTIITTLYFTETLIQSLPPENQKAVRKVASGVLEAIDNLKNYAAANTEGVKALSYYTNLKSADLLVMNKNAKLRYFNVITHALKEDNILLTYVTNENNACIEDAYNNGNEHAENNIYMGRFLPALHNGSPVSKQARLSNDNSLIKWRAYSTGNNKNEGEECSLVIQTGYFAENENSILLQDDTLYLHNHTKAAANASQQLYRVLYYDACSDTITGDTHNEAGSYLQQFKQGLQRLVALGNNNEEVNAVTNKLVYRFISEIRYLFKPAENAFENELRIIEYVSPEDDRIQTEKSSYLPRNLYIESSKKLHPHLNKVMLNPNVPNPEQWMYLDVQMKKNGSRK